MLGGKLASHADGAVGAVTGVGINHVRAIRAQNLLALGGNILRHAQHDGKSLGRAQHGVGDAGVAAGGIEQGLTRAELAAESSFSNDVGSGAVFHRATGVVPFGLAQKCHGGQMRSEPIKAQQRSIADARKQTEPRTWDGWLRRMMCRDRCRQPG